MSATGGPAAAARLVYGPDERAAAAERWGLGDCEAGGAGPAEWAVLTDRLAASTDSLDSAVHRVAMDYLAERQAAAYWEGTPLLPTGPEAEAAAQAAVGARPDCPAARAITATAAENGAGIAEVARSVRHGLARPDEACNEIYDWVDEINAVAARLGCGSVADAEKSCDGAWRLAGELDAGWGTDRLMSLLDLMLEWDRWDEPAAARGLACRVQMKGGTARPPRRRRHRGGASRDGSAAASRSALQDAPNSPRPWTSARHTPSAASNTTASGNGVDLAASG